MGGIPLRQSDRNYGLDLLRSFAIGFILLYHVLPPVSQAWAFGLPAATQRILWCGVDLFFVLSGFLIAGQWLSEGSHGKPFGERLKVFFVRRAFRILPAYWVVLS